MASLEDTMQQLRDYADDRLINGCVYCDSGAQRTTRDHVPSRVLLDVPYPENLPVVPACADCNNGFSLDEQYVACLIECVRVGSTDPEKIERDVVRRILREQSKLRDRLESARQEQDGAIQFVPEGQRVYNVVVKLAQGHAAFELSTPLRRPPDRIGWWVLPGLSDEERREFDAAHVHHLLGEIGSRATQRIMVVQATLRSASGELITAPLIMSDWVEVQEDRYRYLAVDDAGGSMIKIVLGEYLACEVTWFWDAVEEARSSPPPTAADGDLQLNLPLDENG